MPFPANGVIYVGKDTAGGTGAGACTINPYETASQPGLSARSTTCTEGDTYVERELKGQLTIGSQPNIVITRDITYSCADGSGPANQTDPSSVSACSTETNPDVLGLSAYGDIVLSNPVDASGSSLASCGYDGTASTLGQTGSVTGTQSSSPPEDVWPTCDLHNPVVDAAVIALQGSFGVQHYDRGSQQGSAYLNGADVSDYRGPFGVEGSYGGGSGYYNFSYDTRLQLLPLHPPVVYQRMAGERLHRLWQREHRTAGQPELSRDPLTGPLPGVERTTGSRTCPVTVDRHVSTGTDGVLCHE